MPCGSISYMECSLSHTQLAKGRQGAAAHPDIPSWEITALRKFGPPEDVEDLSFSLVVVLV
jgi:hypothetical protein